MQAFDLHNMTQAKVALTSQAISTDTTTAGEIIDTAGFESLEFILLTKALTDGDYAVLMQEGDDSALADAATVAAAEVLGLVNFDDDTDDNAVARTGYIGKKRYVRLNIVSTNTTTGIDIISAVALLGTAHHQPIAAQNG